MQTQSAIQKLSNRHNFVYSSQRFTSNPEQDRIDAKTKLSLKAISYGERQEWLAAIEQGEITSFEICLSDINNWSLDHILKELWAGDNYLKRSLSGTPQIVSLIPGSAWNGTRGRGFASATPGGSVGNSSLPYFGVMPTAGWITPTYDTHTGSTGIWYGLIAFHPNGIDRVVFDLEGGQSTVVDMTYREGYGWAYWVNLNIVAEGHLELRATVIPKTAGQIRVLQGNTPSRSSSMFLSRKNTVNVAYVQNGASNPAVNDSNRPYPSIYAAINGLNAAFGDAGNCVVYLKAGTYDWSPATNTNGNNTTHGCVKIKPAPGLTQNDVLINKSSQSWGLYLTKVWVEGFKVKHENVANSAASVIRNDTLTGYLITYNMLFEGYGEAAPASFTGGFTKSFHFFSKNKDTPSGFGGESVVNCIVENSAEDVLHNVGLVYNLTNNRNNGRVDLGYHPDGVQQHSDFVMDNMLLCNVRLFDCVNSQLIFLANDDTINYPVKDAAIINYNARVNAASVGVSWIGTGIKGLMLYHISTNQALIFKKWNGAETYDNCKIENCIFQTISVDGNIDLNAPAFKWNRNHFISGTAYGTNSTTGLSFSQLVDTNFSPINNIIKNRIPIGMGVVGFDAGNNVRSSSVGGMEMGGVIIQPPPPPPPPLNPPVADFVATAVSGVAPLSVTFFDASSNNPTSWAWDFQNNGSIDSTLRDPSFVYTVPGTYSVKLIATNPDGSGIKISNNLITVTSPPVPPPPPSTPTAKIEASSIKSGGGGLYRITLDIRIQ